MLERRVAEHGVVYYISPMLEQAEIPHAFSTRLGGISPPPFDSLNLGNPSGCAVQDDDSSIQRNYELLQGAIGAAGRRRCWVHQVHGADVLDADDARFESGAKADAVFSADPSKILAVRVADCVPILLADETSQKVAAVHAGWRGVIADVIGNTIHRMPSPTLLAAIGPCIGVDAFEVGSEVIDEFRRTFGDAAPIRAGKNGKGHVDLREACRLQLLEAGVRRIDVSDRCTFGHSDEFFSHRRDNGVTGRMAALIGPPSR